jgi:very-short-patch-repair endonuclease
MKHTFARQLRRQQTEAERRLWQALRGRRFQRFKFRRQQPVGPYIVDFVCLGSRLAIELDGDQHGSEQGLLYDAVRSRRLECDGFKVLRFPNRALMGNFEDVLEIIARTLHSAKPLTRDPR